MIGSDFDPLRYAMQHTFGIVHAVILTLITFGLIFVFPSLMDWSFSLLGCTILPGISIILTMICTGCIQYVCNGYIHIASILRSAWIPPLGIFVVNLFILPLKFMRGGFGPFSALMATSIFMNGIVAWLLQVYSGETDNVPQEASSSEELKSLPT